MDWVCVYGIFTFPEYGMMHTISHVQNHGPIPEISNQYLEKWLNTKQFLLQIWNKYRLEKIENCTWSILKYIQNQSNWRMWLHCTIRLPRVQTSTSIIIESPFLCEMQNPTWWAKMSFGYIQIILYYLITPQPHKTPQDYFPGKLFDIGNFYWKVGGIQLHAKSLSLCRRMCFWSQWLEATCGHDNSSQSFSVLCCSTDLFFWYFDVFSSIWYFDVASVVFARILMTLVWWRRGRFSARVTSSVAWVGLQRA